MIQQKKTLKESKNNLSIVRRFNKSEKRLLEIENKLKNVEKRNKHFFK